MKNKENLYDWLFHYNPYRKVWVAFKREDYQEYFNNKNHGIASSSVNTLVEIIEKTNGDTEKLKLN